MAKTYTVICNFNGATFTKTGTLCEIKDWIGIDHGVENRQVVKSWYLVWDDYRQEARMESLAYRNTIAGLLGAVNLRNERIAGNTNSSIYPVFSLASLDDKRYSEYRKNKLLKKL
jgi:hypothetical protein